MYSVKDRNGKISYVVNTYMDLTELKQTEEKARQQREVLARVERTTKMGQLAGSISHELTQPLTGILSNAQAAELLIKNGQLNNDELTEIIAEIIENTKRSSEVIRNLRELYSEHKGEFYPVNINSVIDESKKLLHSELVKQHVELKIAYNSSKSMVRGNKVQLQQVIVNLIMNGIQAMNDTAKDDCKLYITSVHGENEVKVWVDDYGTGIDDDKIGHIFKPLVTWKPGGTGMGLAINNSIIEAHGGKMFAENRLEGGARVGFILPVLKDGQ
jgi:C4-dicarboxylate-specific signal transduction histidine kinase